MPKKKFCVVSAQRSGSTWLIQLLNSHHQIKTFNAEPFLQQENWFDDVFVPYHHFKQNSTDSRFQTMFKYLDILEEYDSEPHDIIGFKIMYNQIKEYPEFLIKILLDKYRIVHLVRRNHLDVLISGSVAKQYGVYHVKKATSGIRAVTIETASLIDRLDYFENRYRLFKSLLKIFPLPVLEVNYESLAKNKNETLKLIADFIQADSQSLTLDSKLKKVNSGSYQEKIANYEQVAAILKQHSKYAAFLND